MDKIRQDKMGCKTNEMKRGRTLEQNKVKQNWTKIKQSRTKKHKLEQNHVAV